jgi:4-aminobutyrate aminotransferase/(S)-3-amino-2-methylpropionate transaminase
MDTTGKITAGTLARGLITIRAGLYSNCIRLLPPLTVTDEEIEEGMGILAVAVEEGSKK